MTLVNARAAFETAIKMQFNNADPTVTVVFDNMPFTTPGKTKKYVMVNLDFTSINNSTTRSSSYYYGGSIDVEL